MTPSARRRAGVRPVCSLPSRPRRPARRPSLLAALALLSVLAAVLAPAQPLAQPAPSEPVTPAAPAEETEAARKGAAQVHSDAGLKLYHLGQYTAARGEFEAGYQIMPLPAFLANIAQCYRMLGELEQARDYYQRFLANAPPDEPPRHTERADAEQILKEINEQIAARPPAAPAPDGGVADAGPSSIGVTALPPTRPVERPRRTWLWWTLGAAGLVVAGGAVGLGVGLGTRHTAPETFLGTMTVGFQ